MVAKWADSGAPRGNPADLPPAAKSAAVGEDGWVLGKPDLIVKSPEVFVPAVSPDKWGSVGLVPTGVTEDRYVSSVEVREVNDIPRSEGTKTVGGRYVFHHMTYQSLVPGQREGGTSWPIHEIGRNADVFPQAAGRLLAANSVLDLNASHIHANGHDTKAHLEFGFKFFPPGYQPMYKRSPTLLGNGNDLDVKPNEGGQQIHAYATLAEHTKIIAFEPHLHAPGVRMCLEAIWGMNVQQLTCVGYDHNWVKAVHLRRRCGAAPAEGHHPAFDWLPRHHRREPQPGRSAQLGRRRPAVDRQHVHRPRLLGHPHRGAVPGGDGQPPRQHEEPQRLRSRMPAVLGAATGETGTEHPAGSEPAVSGRPGRGRAGLILTHLLAVLLGAGAAGAQTRFAYSSGQPLEPAYEGWSRNADGSYTLYFGYMNTNWLQEFDVPVGADNHFEPGDADLGQPTHFYPRRNPFLFTLQVPKDFGTREITWTLTVNGQTRKAYASLKNDYEIDKQVISTEVGGDNGSLADELRSNEPPDLAVDGARTRTVKAGQPLTLVAIAGDPDNLPARRDGKAQPGMKGTPKQTTAAPRASAAPNSAAVVYRPPVAVVASAGPGLHVSWIVYRGQAAKVAFKPDQDEDLGWTRGPTATRCGRRPT